MMQKLFAVWASLSALATTAVAQTPAPGPTTTSSAPSVDCATPHPRVVPIYATEVPSRGPVPYRSTAGYRPFGNFGFPKVTRGSAFGAFGGGYGGNPSYRPNSPGDIGVPLGLPSGYGYNGFTRY